jgi:hypothetical protein
LFCLGPGLLVYDIDEMRHIRWFFEVYLHKFQKLRQRDLFHSIVETVSLNTGLIINFYVILADQLQTQPREDQVVPNSLTVGYLNSQ